MLKFSLIVVGLCASSSIACAQSYTNMFTAEQLAAVADGMKYATMCPNEENWINRNSMLGNCIGGPSGSPEQAGGGGN